MSTENSDAVADLISQIDGTLERVHTTSLDLSFNELADMYRTGELEINPDYQRIFRWSEGARSRFIESLLLEMPVPPIFVVEKPDGSYSLIDGLQRISSYLHFRGLLTAEHFDPPIMPDDFLVLSDCDIVAGLNGKTFKDLGTALQIRLKRSFVRVEVIRKGSDGRFKYHMFKRLNTGGTPLSEQQVRNCTVRMLDPTFNDFIIELSRDLNFQDCIENISEEQRLSAADQELVLRFFAFKNALGNFKHDVADFMTEYMEGVSDPETPTAFNYSVEREIFKKTFEVLNKCHGGGVFARVKARKPNELSRGFAVYHYEALTLGLQAIIDAVDVGNDAQMALIKQRILDVKQNPDFITLTTGGGKNSPGPLRERINFVVRALGSIV